MNMFSQISQIHGECNAASSLVSYIRKLQGKVSYLAWINKNLVIYYERKSIHIS